MKNDIGIDYKSFAGETPALPVDSLFSPHVRFSGRTEFTVAI
jgi:hypothetical protein